jgi:hypothetical protein
MYKRCSIIDSSQMNVRIVNIKRHVEGEVEWTEISTMEAMEHLTLLVM